MTVLAASGLVKTWRGNPAPALDGVDLEVRQGEVFGLLGPNGAGKTTCIGILCGLIDATRGEVRVHGERLDAAGGEARRALGLVPQDIALYGILTVRENIEYFGRMYGLHGARLRDRVAAVLGMVELAEFADRPVRTLSGGMKRRANLAAGLVHEPSILLLDEPTVGVDAQSRNAILETLERLAAGALTIVYTTHYMEEAERLCKRVVVLDHGKVLAEGAPREIAARHGCTSLEEVFLRLTGKELRDE